MNKRTLDESFEISGEWHLPNSTSQIPGKLSWASKKAYLELHASFTPMNGAIHAHDTHSYPVIHGLTTDSNYFTIFRAMRVNAGLNIGPAGLRQSEKLFSNYLVIGAHVNEDTLYSEVNFRIPGLQIWLSRAGITQTMVHKTETNPLAVIYNIEGLAEESFYLPNIKTTLGWGIERNFSGDLISDINVKTMALLRIKPDEPKTLDWFVEQLGKATTLLAFLAASPMSPDYIQAVLADGSGEADVLISLRESSYCIHKSIHDFYMLRSGMEIDFATVFIKWYEIYDSIAMPSQLALSIFSSEKLWLHVEFLSLMQALEGFHRANMPGLYATESEYELVKNSLTNAIPKNISSDHKAALKARIKYGNEISLRKRLNELIGRLEINIRKFILGGDGSIPSAWVETRNYYTHWDGSSYNSVLNGYAMHKANVRMKHLLRALYLDLVGIPQNAITQALVNRSSESQYLIQLNNTEYHEENPGDNSGAIMRIDVTKPNPSADAT